jgi:hypothetical protein
MRIVCPAHLVLFGTSTLIVNTQNDITKERNLIFSYELNFTRWVQYVTRMTPK